MRRFWLKHVQPWLTRYQTPLAATLFLVMMYGVIYLASPENHRPDTKPVSQLYTDLAASRVQEIVMVDDHREATVKLKSGDDNYLVAYPADYGDDLLNRVQDAKVPIRVEGKSWTEKYQVFISVMSISLMLLIYTFLHWRGYLGRLGLGTGLRKSGMVVAPAQTPSERFSDVGGADEVIEEFRQTVDALKNPERYRAFGVKPLTGFLLFGAPGTGKTLLARAIAGEAGVSFFAMKGSDFMGRWLNDGPRAVREIFAQVRKHGVGIIFIDEIDSIASKRSSYDDSGSKELNNTLNELLAQLDGFGTQDEATILVIGATNRPDDLDPGIKRPGRLTRHAVMPSPDPRAREQILRLHARSLGRVATDVDYGRLAKLTSGMTGAQLAALINEAGLLAINDPSHAEPMVTMKHCLEALETAEVGIARKSREVAERDRRITAVHEGGHTLVALFREHAKRPHRVSIIPRGVSGGHTRMDVGDDLYLTLPQLKATLAVAMGGRAAEKLVYGQDQFTTGAEADLEYATGLATRMVTKLGMGERYTAQLSIQGGHDPRVAEVTAEIDRLVKQAEEEAYQLLTAHRTELDLLSSTLLEVESLDAEGITSLFGQTDQA
jgi:cell division protease FtsH